MGGEVPSLASMPGGVLGSGSASQGVYSPEGRVLAIGTSVGFQSVDGESGRAVNSFAGGEETSSVSAGRSALLQASACWRARVGNGIREGRGAVANGTGSAGARTRGGGKRGRDLGGGRLVGGEEVGG